MKSTRLSLPPYAIRLLALPRPVHQRRANRSLSPFFEGPIVFESLRRGLAVGLCAFVFAFAMAALLLPQEAKAQSSTSTARTPGTPAGSYQLGDADTINLFTGNLNYSLPLMNLGGRGEAQATLGVAIEGQWNLQQIEIPNNYTRDIYSFHAVWSDAFVGSVRVDSTSVQTGESCGGAGDYYHWTATVTYVEPNGTEHAMRDRNVHSMPFTMCAGATQSLGTIFESTSGDFVTFVSDTDVQVCATCPDLVTGYLYFPNGTKSRVVGNQIRWTQDRNGNKIEYSYQGPYPQWVTSITDAIGRVVQIQYGVQEAEPYGLCTKLTFKGFNGQDRVIRISYDSNLNHVLRTTRPGDPTTAQTNIYYDDPNDNILPEFAGSIPNFVKAVWLPDGRSYQFRYNILAQLARVELPTGGAVEYDFADIAKLPFVDPPITGDAGVTNKLTEKRTYDRNDALISTTKISNPTQYTSGVGVPSRGFTVTDSEVFDSAGTRMAKTRHYFHGRPDADYGLMVPWWTGKEFRIETFDLNGTTILRVDQNEWRQRVPTWCNSVWPCSSNPPETAPTNSPFIVETQSTLVNGNLVSKVASINPSDNSWAVDDYNNKTGVWQYGYGVGQAGPLVAQTQTSYNNNTPAGLYLIGLPSTTSIYAINSSGQPTLAASTQILYDEYTSQYPLLTYSPVSGWQNPGTVRGNTTSVRRWLNPTNTWIETHAQYDQCGNVVKTWDARDTTRTNPTQISYSDAFSDTGTHNTYAFPSSVTTSVPDSTGVYGSSVAFTTTSIYDFNTGAAISTTDANGKTTSFDYTDPLDRLKQVTNPDSGRVRFYYSDAASDLYVQALTDLDSTRSIETRQYFDGFGRPIRSFLYDGQVSSPWLVTDTYYDSLGRASQTSNRYRVSTPGPSVPPTCSLCTKSTYDALGRLKSVTTPDNSQVTTDYGVVTSGSHLGTTVLVTEQEGRKRRSVTDALGRLVRVDEPDTNGALGEVNNPTQPTTYVYDVLGNLRLVTQGTQQRFFTYDSLSRLLRAHNPELAVNGNLPVLTDPITEHSVWSTGYTYDNNGNLIQKTDARGVISNYGYDALNRNTTTDYSDTAAINPDITRRYDGATNGRGRLWESYAGGTETTGSNVDHQKIVSYDQMGRPTVQRQRFKVAGTWNSNNYETERQYNLAGNVISQDYPSGRVVTYAYDGAGQTSSFSGNLGGSQRNYATEIIYSHLGGMTKEKFGTDTPLYNKSFYNSRGQLSEIRVSTSYADANDTTWNRGAIINYYSNGCWGMCGGSMSTTSMADNNGNLKKQEVYVPHNEELQNAPKTSWDQKYDYDSLNRLQRVGEYTGDASRDWKQEYVYDRYGNRRIEQNTAKTYGTGINKKDFTVNTVNNQLGVPAGQSGTMTYDPNGNLTTDTYSGAAVTRTYDAENRMTSETRANNYLAASYVYNADGQRVRRKDGSVETWQVYGMDGELLAEYAAGAGDASPQKEYGYRNGQLLITAEPSTSTNVALAANGGVASASSYLGAPNNAYPSYVNNGARTAGANGIWMDNTYQNFVGDWVQVDFNGTKTISEIDVVTQQDTYQNPTEPTLTQTFSLYGITAFDVQYWTGSAWATVPNGSVTGNNKVWRQFTFSPITTSKIRVVVNAGADNAYSRVVEVEAWNSAPTNNVALATNGGTASASSYLGAPNNAYPSYVNNGARTAGANGIWMDNTYQNFVGDWVQVDFNGTKTISEIDVVTQQDTYQNPTEPTLTQTFSLYGITAFDVQYWTGSAWATVPNGSVTGNNKVWRQFTFSPITTSKIRVVVNAGADNAYSRVVEVEAWTEATSGPKVDWLVTDQLGTPRMIFDQTGALGTTKRNDYLPFGEEIPGDVGARTNNDNNLGYALSDTVRQKFTQSERDNETNLDYFLARYYSSTQGRFTGVDMAGSDLGNPQTLNKYQYCLNSPLRKVDRNGLYEDDVHRDLTYVLALAAGFNRVSAWEIADNNQFTDDSPTMSPMGMRPWGSAVDRRAMWHFTTQERRNDLWDAFQRRDNLRDLGIFLHAQQDSFSHQGYEPRWGQMTGGHAPDKTYTDPGKADRMASDTLSYLITALASRVAKGHEAEHYKAVSWESIRPMVEAFNRSKSPQEKQRLIKAIISQLNREHWRQLIERMKKKNQDAHAALKGFSQP